MCPFTVISVQHVCLFRSSYRSRYRGLFLSAHVQCSSLMKWIKCIRSWSTLLNLSWTSMTTWTECRTERPSSSSSGQCHRKLLIHSFQPNSLCKPVVFVFIAMMGLRWSMTWLWNSGRMVENERRYSWRI